MHEVLKIVDAGLWPGKDEIAAEGKFGAGALKMAVQPDRDRRGIGVVTGGGGGELFRRDGLEIEAQFEQIAKALGQFAGPFRAPDTARRDRAGAPAVAPVANQVIGDETAIAELLAFARLGGAGISEPRIDLGYRIERGGTL